jgi:hypothetical protein
VGRNCRSAAGDNNGGRVGSTGTSNSGGGGGETDGEHEREAKPTPPRDPSAWGVTDPKTHSSGEGVGDGGAGADGSGGAATHFALLSKLMDGDKIS